MSTITPDFKSIDLILTQNCNARCKFCYLWGDGKWHTGKSAKTVRREMDYDALERFIRDTCTHKYSFSAVLSGGEPLLYSRLNDLLTLCGQNRIKVHLQTNGYLLDRFHAMIVSNVFAVVVSLDGPPEIHDSVSGVKDLFRTACRNIKNIVENKVKTRASLPIIRIRYTISQYNSAQIKPFIKAIRNEFKSTGANIVFNSEEEGLNPMSPENIFVGFGGTWIVPEHAGMAYAAVMKSALDCDVTDFWRHYDVDTTTLDTAQIKKDLSGVSQFSDVAEEFFGNYDNTFGRRFCSSPFNWLHVMPDGEAYPCVALPDYSLGNISGASFTDVWHGSAINSFRKMLAEGLLPVCNRCCGLFRTAPEFGRHGTNS